MGRGVWEVECGKEGEGKSRVGRSVREGGVWEGVTPFRNKELF